MNRGLDARERRSDMRISMSLSLAVAAFVLAIGAAARAQTPDQPVRVGAPSAAASRRRAAAAPAADRPVQRLSRASGVWLSGAGGRRRRATPSPPSYQQGYYLYPAPGQAPVYYAPPPTGYRGCCCCCQHGASHAATRLTPRLVRPKKSGRRAPLLARRARRLRDAEPEGRQQPGHRSAAPASSCACARRDAGASRCRRASCTPIILVGRLAARRVPVPDCR